MNRTTASAHHTCTPETHTLHHILQAVITDGMQRERPEADIQASAEAAARAFRAGLTAFTAPAEPFAGGSADSTSVSIPATVNYGGAKDAIPQQSATRGQLPPELAEHLEEAARQWAESRKRGLRNYI